MIATKPEPWVIVPSLSRAPGVWDDAAVWPLWPGGAMFYGGRAHPISAVSGFVSRSTIAGLSFGQDTDNSDEYLHYLSPVDGTGISELTCLVWCISNKNYSAGEGVSADTLMDTALDTNNTGFRLFGLGPLAKPRWRLPEAGGNTDITASWTAGDVLQFVGRLGGGNQRIDFWNATTGASNGGQTATTASISLNKGKISLGGDEIADTGSWPGDILLALLQFRRWTDDEIERNREDPFGPITQAEDTPMFAFDVAAAPGGGRIMSSLAHYGGLAGYGGIAGMGGGLAG